MGDLQSAENYGARYLFHGDFIPEERQRFSLSALDLVKEPILTFRWKIREAAGDHRKRPGGRRLFRGRGAA